MLLCSCHLREWEEGGGGAGFTPGRRRQTLVQLCGSPSPGSLRLIGAIPVSHEMHLFITVFITVFPG